MKTSSVEFISRSPNPLPMKSKHHRFSSGLHGSTAADSVRSEWPLWHAAKSNAVFARRRIEMKLKLLDIRADRRVTSPLVRLVEGEERWEAPDHRQGVLPQNRGGNQKNRSVTCMVLKATANDKRHSALCHDEFRGP
ncbi:zinc finger protein [Trichonephila clavipes]|nr:zinc finger protein [Trichonephila clavipes]